MSSLPYFKFDLYVAGSGVNSLLAIANINALCREQLAGRHEIKIIDILQEPPPDDNILLTPMLIKLSPAPICKIVGNLKDRNILLHLLGLPI
jgi:circadian clock protein KaiB